MKKEHGVYRITGKLPDPRISAKKADATRHIDAVISGLGEFSKGTAKPIGSHDEAVTSICTFLTQFNIPCLRAYLRGTAIPVIDGQAQSQVVLVSKYVLALQNTDPRDHQLLRSSHLAQTELMDLTLGEEEALTEQTVTETLRRVTKEIKKEESNKYRMERAEYQETRKQLVEQRTIKKEVQERLYWHCRRRATGCAWCASTIIFVLLIVGLAAGVGVRLNNPITGWLLVAASIALILLTLVNLTLGISVRRFHEGVQARCLTWFIRRKAAETGLDLTEL